MSTVGLPPVPASITDPEVRRWMEAVLETVAIRDGQRGDPLDRAVTVRELLGTGIAQLSQNSRSATSSVQIEATDQSPFTDLTPPENPRFFEVHANPRSVVLTWSKNQIFNVAHAEIHRSETDQFDDSVLIGVSPGQSYADTDVVSEQTYYYWVRYISYSNIPGAFFDLDPVSATVPLIGDNQLADINVDKLIGNKAAFVEANINEGSITNAMIGNEIRSDNYVAGSAGWRINKFGDAEFNNMTASGNINGAYIRGSIVEGSLIIKQTTDTLVATEADMGFGSVRHLALPYVSEQVVTARHVTSLSNRSFSSRWSNMLPIVSADYTAGGTVFHDASDQNAWANFNRFPYYYINPEVILFYDAGNLPLPSPMLFVSGGDRYENISITVEFYAVRQDDSLVWLHSAPISFSVYGQMNRGFFTRQFNITYGSVKTVSDIHSYYYDFSEVAYSTIDTLITVTLDSLPSFEFKGADYKGIKALLSSGTSTLMANEISISLKDITAKYV